MKVLGVDYGQKKIGLALAESNLATPLKVISVDSLEDAVKKVKKVAKVEQVEQVVLGVSESKMAEETKEFGKKI